MKPHTSKTVGISLLFVTLLSVIAPFSYRTFVNVQVGPGTHSYYCTIFSIAKGEKVLFGNNEDYRFAPETSFISFVPRQEIPNFRNLPGFNDTIAIYGLMVVGSIVSQNNQNFYCPQGGMNDQGLCFDANSIPDQILDTSDSDWNPMNAHWDVLWHCRTVEDVIKWYENHTVSYSPWNGQWNYVDATGEGVVVTAADGEIKFIGKEDESYLVSTNFNRADPSSHYFDYPCWRYDTAVSMLEEIGSEDELTVDACQDILDATHFEKGIFNDIQTLYSTIYDPVNLNIYLNYLHNFDETVILNLEDECAKIDTLSANHSFYSQIQDRTFIMKDFFNETNSESSVLTYAFVGLGLGVPILVLLVLFFYRRRR